MATQREVVEAFLNFENSPRRASNFRMEVLDDNYTAFLIGDDRAVYAERRPLREVTFYGRQSYYSQFDAWVTSGLTRRGLADQHQVVDRVVRRLTVENGGPTSVEMTTEAPKHVDEIDEL